MKEKSDDIDLPWWQKFLLLAGVSAVLFLIFFIASLFNPNPEPTVDFSSCDTMFNPAPCPDPNEEYEQQEIEDSKKYPDADPYGNYIDRSSAD